MSIHLSLLFQFCFLLIMILLGLTWVTIIQSNLIVSIFELLYFNDQIVWKNKMLTENHTLLHV